MARVFLIVLDSVGVGGAEDADAYGDAGADTLGHIAEAWPSLALPNLAALGLWEAAAASTGRPMPPSPRQGGWGYAVETSNGKDTPSGHWEIAGAPVDFDWGYFPHEIPAFPGELTEALIARAGLPGLLGLKHASGSVILEELGAEHIRTGKPIVYTSVDSVFQIAAHEQAFELERLYETCAIARELVDRWRIGRVIARPFLGDAPGGFTRTKNRRDYATPPHRPTLFDRLAEAGRPRLSIGKIGDIFAHRATGEEIRGKDDQGLIDATIAAMGRPDAGGLDAGGLGEGGLAMTNLVEFDMLFGHRRDVAGYAAALEAFDRRLPDLLAALGPDDLLILTADHGCDPTWRGADHTRENVPILTSRADGSAVEIGRRESFADIGQTAARWLGIAPLSHGESWL